MSVERQLREILAARLGLDDEALDTLEREGVIGESPIL